MPAVGRRRLATLRGESQSCHIQPPTGGSACAAGSRYHHGKAALRRGGDRLDKPVVSEELILFPTRDQAETDEQLIALLCARLTEQGYADPAYLQAVLERERTFPTGLPTVPFATAIPHAGSDHVRSTGIAIAVLRYPVPFRSMEAPDTSLGVWVAWLLAVGDAGKQVAMLQWVITTLQDRSLMEKLVMAAEASEVMALLEPVIEASVQSL